MLISGLDWDQPKSPTPLPVNVIDRKNFSTNSNWSKNHERILRLVVSDPAVKRVFVNAAIKNKLCNTSSNKKWLRKIRPWGGHNYHFHVRIKCPKGSLNCVDQKPVVYGSGCGEAVARWDWRKWKRFTKKKRKKRSKQLLPEACRNLWKVEG